MTNYRPITQPAPQLNEQAIFNYLQNRSEVCVREIWTQALGYPLETKPTRTMSNHIIRCLNNFGWDKADRQRTQYYGQQWVFSPTRPAIQQFGITYNNIPRYNTRADLAQATALLAQAVEILQRACL